MQRNCYFRHNLIKLEFSQETHNEVYSVKNTTTVHEVAILLYILLHTRLTDIKQLSDGVWSIHFFVGV
jgi:hypothetical protein